jgi:hypothetical protein
LIEDTKKPVLTASWKEKYSFEPLRHFMLLKLTFYQYD